MDAPAPNAIPPVTTGVLAAALGMTRSSVLRAVASGRLPMPDGERIRGSWRTWPHEVALALEVARALPDLNAKVAMHTAAKDGPQAARVALAAIPTHELSRLPTPLSARVRAIKAGAK